MRHVVIAVGSMLSLLAAAATAQFTNWSAPINLGPPVNTSYVETCVAVSKNGLSMYFSSNRPGGLGGLDLYLSRRADVNSAWGEPQLVPNVNSSVQENCPALSPDEHRLFFASARSGGCGGLDIYVSRRHDRKDDLGWQPPVNLGCTLNSPLVDGQPNLFEDETGTEVMYFNSNRSGNHDIYVTRQSSDDTFGPPIPVAELNTPNEEGTGAVRRDGLEIVFVSDRPGGAGNRDLWTANRNTTSAPWSAPVNLVGLNSSAYDGGRMQISFDGLRLYFRSDRLGQADLYVATREKLRQ